MLGRRYHACSACALMQDIPTVHDQVPGHRPVAQESAGSTTYTTANHAHSAGGLCMRQQVLCSPRDNSGCHSVGWNGNQSTLLTTSTLDTTKGSPQINQRLWDIPNPQPGAILAAQHMTRQCVEASTSNMSRATIYICMGWATSGLVIQSVCLPQDTHQRHRGVSSSA